MKRRTLSAVFGGLIGVVLCTAVVMAWAGVFMGAEKICGLEPTQWMVLGFPMIVLGGFWAIATR